MHEAVKKERSIVVAKDQDGNETLLSLSLINDGKGATIAQDTLQTVKEWKIANKITTIVLDTCSVNFGVNTGTIFLKQMKILLNQNQIYLIIIACHHHLIELLLKAVFIAFLGKTKGVRHQQVIDFKSSYTTPIKASDACTFEDHPDTKRLISITERSRAIALTKEQLKKNTSRADYSEYLNMVLVFLGAADPDFLEKTRLKVIWSHHSSRF